MLKSKVNLTLAYLKTILKDHFKEDSTTDMFNRLVNITQDAKESLQNFLFRAIEPKERLIAAAQTYSTTPNLFKRSSEDHSLQGY